MSNNQGSYAALFQLETALAKEHCRTKLSQIKMIGRDLHQQVRIEFPTANGTTSAIYTVSTVHNGEPDLVFLGEKIQDELNNCQEHSNIHTCIGEVKAQVPFEGLTDEQAEACGEFIERLSHNGQNHKLVVIAPHGGEIEAWTDKQAEYIGNQFSSEHVSLWICKGFNKGNDSALKRWHITSTDISEKSFPKLNTIFGPKFEYSIAFHGWTKDSICVGGSKNQTPPNLKERIKNTIQETLLAKGSDIQVNNSDSPEGCPEGFNGDKDENIVNRLGTNGIQIEQCMKAREKYHDDIAQAVADAIRPWINM
jgi:phage replication-related protein YjqB (UPF0714/DUF867 family)